MSYFRRPDDLNELLPDDTLGPLDDRKEDLPDDTLGLPDDLLDGLDDTLGPPDDLEGGLDGTLVLLEDLPDTTLGLTWVLLGDLMVVLLDELFLEPPGLCFVVLLLSLLFRPFAPDAQPSPSRLFNTGRCPIFSFMHCIYAPSFDF